MKAKVLISALLVGLLSTVVMLSGSNESSANHLDELTKHWMVNKSSFDELVTLVTPLEEYKLTSIMLNGEGTLSITSDIGFSLENTLEEKIIQLMNKINISRIRFSSTVITLSEFNAAIGDDLETMIRLTSSYMFYLQKMNDVGHDESCTNIKMPPTKTTACDLILNDKWVIAHSIIVPSTK